jgi:twitching motility protein PilI
MARNSSLREFQESLAARLREAASEPASSSRLGFRSGNRNWLLKLEDAGEIVPLPDVAPVPLTKPWFLGLANVRGTLVSVVDLALFIGAAPTLRSVESRLMLAPDRLQARAGILVDRMLGLHAVQAMTAAEKDRTDIAWMGAALRDTNGQIWHELDMQGLVNNNDFLQAGA